MEEVEKVTVTGVSPEEKITENKCIIREVPFTIVVNGKELATLQCTPSGLQYLTAGFLVSEGVLKRKEEIKRVILDEKDFHVRIYVEADVDVQTLAPRKLIASAGVSFYRSGDGKIMPHIESQLRVSRDKIFYLTQQFQTMSSLYKRTRGNHSAALCSVEGTIIAFAEDIGRHNAVDKVLGECLLKGISVGDKILMTSGRISVEILTKAARRGVPIIVSFGAPTSLAVSLAKNIGMTIVCFAREQYMAIFAGDQRVT